MNHSHSMDDMSMGNMTGMSMGGMSMNGTSMNSSSMNSTSMSMSSSHDMPMMMTYFFAHTPTVPLWFSGWTPKNAGAVFGACVGLFMLSVLTKLLEAYRHQAQLAWSDNRWHDSGIAVNSTEKLSEDPTMAGAPGLRRSIQSAPWRAKREIPRGLLCAIHAALGYFLMLAVMTFNVYYFVAIILGVFVGEVAFGRISSVGMAGHH